MSFMRSFIVFQVLLMVIFLLIRWLGIQIIKSIYSKRLRRRYSKL